MYLASINLDIANVVNVNTDNVSKMYIRMPATVQGSNIYYIYLAYIIYIIYIYIFICTCVLIAQSCLLFVTP